jgi:predicted phage terminase large subunit-like protein
VVKEFSAAPLRYDNDADITIARDRCLEADRLGYWPFELVASSASSDRGLSWTTLAAAVASNVCERIVKEGSRTHLLNDLEKRVAALSGPVCPETLLLWVKEVDPVAESAGQLLQRQVPGLVAITPRGNKASRAHAVAPLLEAGQVRFAAKAQSLIDELLAFSPKNGVDDQVDAFCQGVLWIEAQHWRSRGLGRAPVPMLFSR